MVPQSSIFDGSDETLVNAVQTRQFFGGVSEMLLARRERERDQERERGGTPFPPPRIIAGRKYFVLGELRRYRDSRPRFKVIEREEPQRKPPSQSREAKAARRAAKAAPASSSQA
jgi:hypothetical protein